jgi:type IV pilus assembly protein PilQ
MKIALNLKQTAKSGRNRFNDKKVLLNNQFWKGNTMRSPIMKSKGLKLLTVLAFVIAVCVIAIAENGNEDSKQKEASITQPIDQNTQGQNEDPKQNDVPVIQPIDQTTQEPNEDSKQKGTPTALDQRMQKTISVDFRNTPIEDVVRIMAEQANVDIITSPNVTGNVTATLTNVPLLEALDNILTAHGYAYVVSENMIRVAPAGEITEKAERLVNRIYRIYYADVKEVEKALTKVISKRGSLSSNTGTSNIIVNDTESKIKAIDAFIEEIDRITPQIMVEARVYDVTSTEGFDIGAEWTAGRNNPITGISNVDTFNEITGTSTTNVTTKTTNTAWQDSDAGEGASIYRYRKSNPFVGGSFDSDTAGTIRLGLLDTVNVDIALNVLRTQVGAKLLANPRILVLDNETAEFKIISEIPYTEQSSTSSGGSMTSTQFKDVGVELKVKPHVTRDGMIRLDIIPKFSVVSELGSIIPNGGGLRGVPTVDTREVNTKALVKDGQTVVLGGLRKRTVSQDVSKIPILGDVPILGNLFTDVSEEVETNELVIFITPRIIIEPTLSQAETKGLEATEFGSPKVTYTEDEKAEMAEKNKE